MFIKNPKEHAYVSVVGSLGTVGVASKRFLAVLFAQGCQDVRVIGMKSPCKSHNMPDHLSAGWRRQGNNDVGRNFIRRQDVKAIISLKIRGENPARGTQLRGIRLNGNR